MLGVFQKYFPLMDNNALLANEEEFLSFGLNLAKGKDFMDMFAGYDVLKRFWSAGSENARKAMEELSDHLKYMLYWAKPPAVEPADKDNALVIIGEMRRDRVID
jgi:hypothetical protein